MLVSLTVGKVDAGVAVLLTEDKRLIEFPSILLPPDIHSGSIVDVTVAQNLNAEAASAKAFQTLQTSILSEFGYAEPTTPVLKCRNATQTSVVLEWDPIELATADLRSLTLYRKGNKAGTIPKPFENTSTKISGLAVDTEYDFQLILRTSAGTYTSEKLVVRTHKMTDLSGITVTPGIMPAPLRDSLEGTIERMGAKLNESVRIDTTHFVCTEGHGEDWERAMEMNVPVVVPDWVKGCEREGRIVGVRGYYLNADPKLRQVGPGAGLQRNESQQSEMPMRSRQESRQELPSNAGTPRTEITPATPEKTQQERRPEVADDEDEEDEVSSKRQAEQEDEARSSKDDERHRGEEDMSGGDSQGDSEEEDNVRSRADGSAVGSNASDEGDLGQQLKSPTAKHIPGTEEEPGGAAEEGNFDEVKL
ncbi:MAG: Chitin synthase, class 5 [Chrysothrix sp. TS-e1954]|nr:MAG: Chitin synthase, class 5 [Chrysothrix sp. TS-e1954]